MWSAFSDWSRTNSPKLAVCPRLGGEHDTTVNNRCSPRCPGLSLVAGVRCFCWREIAAANNIGEASMIDLPVLRARLWIFVGGPRPV